MNKSTVCTSIQAFLLGLFFFCLTSTVTAQSIQKENQAAQTVQATPIKEKSASTKMLELKHFYEAATKVALTDKEFRAVMASSTDNVRTWQEVLDYHTKNKQTDVSLIQSLLEQMSLKTGH